jgi:hypothetical protein
MTTQKTFKRRVRARMAKTGESYTAARRQLIAAGDAPDPGTPTYETVVSDDKMRDATGRSHEQWFEILDTWGAATRTHTEIAGYVNVELGVDGWWAQSITVSYERARGLRAVGQMKDGWTINASKTVGVAVGKLFEAVVEAHLRKEWLPDADMSLRTATKPKSSRFNWEDGSTRVNISFESKGPRKATVFVSHERLPDADTADEMKAYWRAALVDLKAHLEAPT